MEPKRAVDPRAEALRFFPADTQVIAALRIDRRAAIAELDGALGDLGALRRLRATVDSFPRVAGLDSQALVDLALPEDPALAPVPEVFLGAINGDALRSGDLLFVMPTERADELEEMFGSSVDDGRLQNSGEYDEASLYQGKDVAFAVRDGVLLAARDIDRLQLAIDSRDGDADLHLDDDEVDAALDEVPQAGPLLVYLDVNGADDRAGVIAVDPAIRAMFEEAPWTTSLAGLAMSLSPQNTGVTVDIEARLLETTQPDLEPPLSEAPSAIVLTREEIGRVLGGSMDAASPIRSTVSALAPIRGQAYLADEQLIAKLRLSD